MKTTHKLNIEVTVTFDNWTDEGKISKQRLIEKAKEFVEEYFPMAQTILGEESGTLEIKFNKITSVKTNYHQKETNKTKI